MKTRYQCNYCNREYEDFEEARECAVDCSHDDLVVTIHICDYCKKTSGKESKISDCEKLHELDQDEFYHKVKFDEATEHPSQSKLT